jgi:hypothetical protein
VVSVSPVSSYGSQSLDGDFWIKFLFPSFVAYVKLRSSLGHNGVWNFRIEVRLLYVDEGGSSIRSDGSRV